MFNTFLLNKFRKALVSPAWPAGAGEQHLSAPLQPHGDDDNSGNTLSIPVGEMSREFQIA